MQGVDELVHAGTAAPDPAHDVAIECMELAYAFRSSTKTLPAAVPYVPLHEIRARAKPLEMASPESCKVGLLWASIAWDRTRSLPLRDLAPLGTVGEAAFCSLQQGPEAAELADAPFPIVSLAQQTGNLREAGLHLDLIITVATMAAHLAGALGRPVWLLLLHHADWRWMKSARTPLYPTMRISARPQQADGRRSWNKRRRILDS